MGRYRWISLRWISLTSGLLIVVMTYFPLVFVVSNSLKSGQSIFSSGVFSLFTQFDYQNYGTAWAGVSRPLVYRYFPGGKQQLYEAALRSAADPQFTIAAPPRSAASSKVRAATRRSRKRRTRRAS